MIMMTKNNLFYLLISAARYIQHKLYSNMYIEYLSELLIAPVCKITLKILYHQVDIIYYY